MPDSSGRVFLSAPDVGALEREALLRAFDSGWIAPVGPELDGFEQDLAELTGWNGTVALSSGTAALHLALLVAGVQPGDDVLVSTFTFAATANAVVYAGAVPCFIDSETTTWNMSPQLLADELDERAATNRLPAAVVVVDLYGQCADYDEIVPICERYGVPVIEDAAEALGAQYRGRPAGTLATSGIFSFNGNKIMTTSGGGAFVSAAVEVADRVRYLATQARQPAVHYEHTDVGFNYRLSNLLAAIGRGQLTRLDEMSKRRCETNRSYRSAFSDIDGLHFMPVPDWSGWNGWLTCVYFDDASRRDRVRGAMAEQNIESRALWKPMHLQPLYADAPVFERGVSAGLFETGLCLPSGSGLTDAELDRVISTFLAALDQ